MNKITTSIFAALIVGAFALSACGSKDEAKSGDKCSTAVNHVMSLSMKAMDEMLKTMPEDKRKEAKAQMDEKMKEETVKAVKKCGEKLKADPKLEKTLDCLIAAKEPQAIQACEGAEALMKD